MKDERKRKAMRGRSSYSRSGSGGRGYTSGNGYAGGCSRRGGAMTLNFPMLGVTAVLGVIAWLVGSLIYNALIDVWAAPVVIGLIFTALAVIVLVGILVISSMQGTFE